MKRTLLFVAIVFAPASALGGQDDPYFATFSICALDPRTGELGVAVTTRVPGVGNVVPWVRAAIGAVATQALTNVSFGERGLALLEKGLSPDKVIQQLLAEDDKEAHNSDNLPSTQRQLGIIDSPGRTAADTGSSNGSWGWTGG